MIDFKSQVMLVIVGSILISYLLGCFMYLLNSKKWREKMMKFLIKKIRGSNDFKLSLDIKEDYVCNTFPLHISFILLFMVIAFIQSEWNWISLNFSVLVIVDMNLVSYKLGYADMKRTLKQTTHCSYRR